MSSLLPCQAGSGEACWPRWISSVATASGDSRQCSGYLREGAESYVKRFRLERMNSERSMRSVPRRDPRDAAIRRL